MRSRTLRHALPVAAGAAVLALTLSACGSFLSETTSDVAGIAGAGAAGSTWRGSSKSRAPLARNKTSRSGLVSRG